MDKLNGEKSLKESYKKMIKKRPFIEDALIIGGTCLLGLTVLASIKFMSNEPVDLDIKLNPNEEAYYSANYDAAITKYKEKEEKEKWPIWVVKEAEIDSLKGDKLNSDVKLANAYRERNKIISEEGLEKYREDDKALGNYICFTYLMNGEVEKSIEYGQDFLKSNSKNNELRESLMVAYISNGDIENAKKTLEGYVENDNAYDLAKEAELNILVNNYEKGLTLLDRAYKLDNNEIRILDTIDSAIFSNNFEFVKKAKEVFDADNNNEVAKLVLYKNALINESDEKNKIIEELKTRNVKNVIYDKIILEYINYDENSDLVSEIVNDLEENYKENYGACYILGQYYLRTKNINKSLEYGKKSVKIKDQYANNYGVLFPAILKEKNKDDLKTIAPYLRRGLYYEPYSSIIINNTGKYYNVDMQETDIAYRYYTLLSKVAPNDSKAFYNMALLNERREEKDLAIANMEKAIELDNNNVNYLNALGVIYFTFDNPDKGIELIRKAYELDNNNIVTLNNAAVYYGKYSNELNRAMENIKESYELSKNSKNMLLKSEVESNYNEIKKNYDLYKDEDISTVKMNDLKLIR